MPPDRIASAPLAKTPAAPQWQPRQARRPHLVVPASVGWLAFGLLAFYLLSPTLSATHVEGFTALIQLDAIAAHLGLIDRADLLYPVQAEYFYVTRQGVVLLLRGLMRLSGTTSDEVFRFLTLLCFVAFLGATVAVARRHSGLGWPAILGALLLVPGLCELGFYFSDGIVSVAFGVLGLLLLPRARGPGAHFSGIRLSWALRGLLAGAALGMAVLARTDSALLLPLAAALAWLDQRQLRSLLVLGVLVGAGMVAVFTLSYALSGTTVLQAFEIGRFFDQLHDTARPRLLRAAIFVLFFGLPGLALAVVGVVRSLRTEPLRRLLVLVAAPGLLLAFALWESTETRQIYPLLAPFVVVQCGRGIEWTWAALTGAERGRRWVGAALVLGTALAWVAPPVLVPVRDGPRPVFGRLWSPPMWRAWQGRVAASTNEADALVATAERLPRMVAITAHFNSDHYFQLRAWQRGWRPLRPGETADRCAGGVQIWRNGDRRLAQVRLEDPYGIARMTPEYYAALQMEQALKCPAVTDGAPVFLSDFAPPLSDGPMSERLRTALPAFPPPLASFGWPAAATARVNAVLAGNAKTAFALPTSFGVTRNAPVGRELLAELPGLAAAALETERSRPDNQQFTDFAAFSRLFQTRFWHPPASSADALTR